MVFHSKFFIFAGCDATNNFVDDGNGACVCDAVNNFVDDGNGGCGKLNHVSNKKYSFQ